MADKTGYIGRNPGDSSVTIARQTFTPTSNTSEFSFTSGYTVGLCDVYLNGVKLINGTDYEANTGSTVGLTSTATSGDVVEIVAYKAFNIGQVNSASGDFTVAEKISVGSTATLSGVTTCEGDLYVGGDLYGDGSNLTGIANTAYIDAASITSSGIVSVTNTTASTSSATGALIVSGGVGIAGSLHVGENVSVGGTLTYEDVTNIDSVGVVTARLGVVATAGRGVEITAGGLNVAAGIATLTGYVSTGSTVGAAGSIYFPDNKGINFGGNPEGDLQIYHDAGAHNYVSAVTGDLLLRSNYVKLQTPTGENCIETKLNGSVDLFWDNTKKFNTDSAGTYTTGIHTASQSLHAGTTVQLDGGTGIVTATSYQGDGSALTGVGGEFDITSCLFI